MNQTVICHGTHKVAAGFEFRVFTVGYQVPTVMLKTGLCATRAKATRQAKAWKMYFKRQGA
jgi:hypothetical protein